MAAMKTDPNCIFCRIVAGQVPSRRVHDDPDFVVFHDIAPWAPVHVLMAPKEHVATLYAGEERHAAMWGRMVALAPVLMRELGVVNGFRVVVNTGPDGLQEVPHVHVHVVPRFADQPLERRGPAVFGALGVPPDECVSEVRMNELAVALRARLTS